MSRVINNRHTTGTNASKEYEITVDDLDWSVVIHGKVKGWGSWIFEENCHRTYERNALDLGIVVVTIMASLLVCLCVYIHHYFPIWIFSIFGVGGVTLGLLCSIVQYANKTYISAILAIIFGLLGTYNHWDIGVSIFNFHLERYYFEAFILFGAIALYRRGWNAFVWFTMDKVVLRYYKKNNLPLTPEVKSIQEYKKAYEVLQRMMSDYLKKNNRSTDAKQLDEALSLHTNIGLMRANTLLNNTNAHLDLIKKSVSEKT